jgi:hypothetical protein
MFGRYRKIEHRCIVMEHQASWLRHILEGTPPSPPPQFFGTRHSAALNQQLALAWDDAMSLWRRVGGPCLRAAIDRHTGGPDARA